MKANAKIIDFISREYTGRDGEKRKFNELQLSVDGVEGVLKFSGPDFHESFSFDSAKREFEPWSDVVVEFSIGSFKEKPKLQIKSVESA